MNRPIAILIFSAVTLIVPFSILAQDSVNFPNIGEVLRMDKDLDQVIDKDAKIEVLSSGFTWSEGPAWVKEGGYLIFSDVWENRVIKWQEGVGAEVWLEPAGYTGIGHYSRGLGSNGLAMDNLGRLISCDQGDRRLSVMEFGQGKRTIADNFQGKRFNSPNDVTVAITGRIYFTDPPYGLPQRENDPTREIDFCGVYYLDRSGKVSLVTNELPFPNGIDLSHDERTLFVAQSETDKPIVMAYTLNDDGTAKSPKGKLFFDASPYRKYGEGNPDGIKTDQSGNLWVTGMGGVMVVNPDGKLIGHVRTGEKTSNCAWGDDGSTLYITADTYLCRIQTKVVGRRF